MILLFKYLLKVKIVSTKMTKLEIEIITDWRVKYYPQRVTINSHCEYDSNLFS